MNITILKIVVWLEQTQRICVTTAIKDTFAKYPVGFNVSASGTSSQKADYKAPELQCSYN